MPPPPCGANKPVPSPSDKSVAGSGIGVVDGGGSEIQIKALCTAGVVGMNSES